MSDPQAQKILEKAWSARNLEAEESLRVFHGPGDAPPSHPLSEWAIEVFGAHAWVTAWGRDTAEVRAEMVTFLKGRMDRKILSAVLLVRPEKGVPEDPSALFGEPPVEAFANHEGKARYWIRMLSTKHPGLFLDHAPLRRWLEAAPRGARVLNGFSYTGSLSVAAALGGAAHVTSLDLSKPYTQWARENWALNGLGAERADFIYGDVFDWLPRLRKKGRRFDCVILDPPSYSRGTKGDFSTARDLRKLHELAFSVLEPGLGGAACLITSINSANVTREQYWKDVAAAAESAGFVLKIVEPIRLPPTFPEAEPYLKGWILEVTCRPARG